MEEDGTFDLLPKKEVAKLQLEIEKLEKFLGGIKNMKSLPGALFIVDPRQGAASPLPRPASWASPSWPSWTPTATPMRSTM